MLAHLLALLCVLPLRGGERACDGSMPAACFDACAEEVPVRAVESLAQGGEASVPALIGMLSDTRAPVRCAAARVLGEMGHAARRAAEPLAQALIGATADEEFAWTCSRALASLQVTAKPAVAPLARAVANEQAAAPLRCLAAITLGSLGEHAREAVPAMLACFEETPTTLVQPIVAIQLGRIGKPAVAQLDNDLAKQKPIVQLWRIVAIASAGEDALGASTKLLPLVLTDEWMIHPAVHHALERMGGRAASARERARRDEEQREKGMRKGGLFDNWSIAKPAYVLPFFHGLGIDDKLAVSLPDKLAADKNNFAVGDAIEALSVHFMDKLESCRAKLETDSVRSHRELDVLFYGVPGLAECLRRFSEAKHVNKKLMRAF